MPESMIKDRPEDPKRIVPFAVYYAGRGRLGRAATGDGMEILSTFQKIESLLIFHFEIRACSQSEWWYFFPSLALHAIR